MDLSSPRQKQVSFLGKYMIIVFIVIQTFHLKRSLFFIVREIFHLKSKQIWPRHFALPYQCGWIAWQHGKSFCLEYLQKNKLCKTWSLWKTNQSIRLNTALSIKYFLISTRTLSSRYPSKPGWDRRQEQLESSPQPQAACPTPSLEADQLSWQPPALSTSSFSVFFSPRRTPEFSVNKTGEWIQFLACVVLGSLKVSLMALHLPISSVFNCFP